MEKYIYMIMAILFCNLALAQDDANSYPKRILSSHFSGAPDDIHYLTDDSYLDEIASCVLQYRHTHSNKNGSSLDINYAVLSSNSKLDISGNANTDRIVKLASDVVFSSVDPKVNMDPLIKNPVRGINMRVVSEQNPFMDGMNVESVEHYDFLNQVVADCKKTPTYNIATIQSHIEEASDEKALRIVTFNKFDAAYGSFKGWFDSFDVVVTLADAKQYKLNIPNIEAYKKLNTAKDQNKLFIAIDQATCKKENAQLSVCNYTLRQPL
jgi:hypothetical protein